MATETQIHANRQNAQASTGPKSEPGKQTSAQNARTTGLYSTPNNAVFPHELDIWTEFVQSFQSELAPLGLLERTFASEITHAAWRLRRCNLVESDPDPETETLQPAINRARSTAQRSFHRNVSELRKLQTERQFRCEYFPEGHDASTLGLASTRELIPVLQKTAAYDPVRDEIALFQTLKNAVNRPNWVRSAKSENASPTAPQTPRSAPCPCGSGQKYKRCCGLSAPAVLGQNQYAHPNAA